MDQASAEALFGALVVGRLRDDDAPETFMQAVALVGPERATDLLRARGLEYDVLARSTTAVSEAFDDAMQRRRDRQGSR